MVGHTNLAALVPADASALYARNLLDFLKLVIDKEGQFHLNREDDIVAACLMCTDGASRAQATPPEARQGRDMDLISDGIYNLIIFVLAIYVGYHVVWNVTPALHTPLMAVTNAISAIVIVGAMLAAALTETGAGQDHGHPGRGAGRGQRVRRLPGHPAHAGNVQEEGRRRPRWRSNAMSMNLVTLLYLVASVCFIQALKGLSHPTSSRRGNLFGMIGMAIAVLTTVALIVKLARRGWQQRRASATCCVGLLVGGTVGTIMAKRVEMTKMPELVAFMHSMIGLAAVFIAIAAVVEPQSLGIVATHR